MAVGPSREKIDRGIEYLFNIKLLGLPFQASGFLAQICLIARHRACVAGRGRAMEEDRFHARVLPPAP
jgi:hypothetical protein